VNILVGFAAAQAGGVRDSEDSADAGQDPDVGEGGHGSIRGQRQSIFDPYKNFKFRVKWTASTWPASARSRAVSNGLRKSSSIAPAAIRAPSTSPRAHEVRSHHARARGDTRSRVSRSGRRRSGASARTWRRCLAQGLPQGHHHRGLQRGGQVVLAYHVFRCWSRNIRRCPISMQRQRCGHRALKIENEAGDAIRRWSSRPSGVCPDGTRSMSAISDGELLHFWEAAQAVPPVHRPAALLARRRTAMPRSASDRSA